MASSVSSLSVPIECVNICKLDCGAFSCAGKSHRVLSGFLASTAHAPQSSLLSCSLHGRRNQYKSRYEALGLGKFYFTEDSNFECDGKLFRSSLLLVACKNWKLHCSSSLSSNITDEVSPESLWEDLKLTISYLPPNELEFVHKASSQAYSLLLKRMMVRKDEAESLLSFIQLKLHVYLENWKWIGSVLLLDFYTTQWKIRI